MVRSILILGLLSLAVSPALSHTAASRVHDATAKVSVDSLKFLVGKWVGEGTAETGQAGGGYCSFEPGLQNQVLVRKSHSEYPATKDHAAIVHDDMMIIYPDRRTQQLRAFYTDNEGHVIQYTVTAAGDGKSAVFLGDEAPAMERYRLTYTVTQPDHMTIAFEMAPPGHPDRFRKIIEGKMKRVPATK